jgi:F0F1-type ATP synthase beta subunit
MGNSVMIERLISNNFIDFINCIYGIYIPADDVLNRLKYNWFARLSPEQVLESDTTIGKQLLIAQ